MSEEQEAPSVPVKPKMGWRKLLMVLLVAIAVIVTLGYGWSYYLSHYNDRNPYGSSLVRVPGPSPKIDEQEIISFSGDYVALSFNLTAVAQQNNQGYGPAYLLNGYSNTGFWYQVGVSYHWPSEINNTSYRFSGFTGVYEVFASNGTSIFPAKGGGILVMNIHAGDPLNLYLGFLSNGTVKFAVTDFKTKSTGVKYYPSLGATYFQSTGPVGNSIFFTGLMTEFYHSTAYYGNETPVTYTPYGGTIDYAYVGVDEWNTTYTNGTFIFANSSPYLNLSLYPTGYRYTYEGATIVASSTFFTTG